MGIPGTATGDGGKCWGSLPLCSKRPWKSNVRFELGRICLIRRAPNVDGGGKPCLYFCVVLAETLATEQASCGTPQLKFNSEERAKLFFFQTWFFIYLSLIIEHVTNIVRERFLATYKESYLPPWSSEVEQVTRSSLVCSTHGNRLRSSWDRNRTVAGYGYNRHTPPKLRATADLLARSLSCHSSSSRTHEANRKSKGHEPQWNRVGPNRTYRDRVQIS